MLYDDLTITLSDSITYRLPSEGISKTSKVLICSAPTSKDGKTTAYLKQHFMRALLAWQRQNASLVNDSVEQLEETDENPPEELLIPASLISVILLNADLDFYEYQLKFQQLICGNVGLSELVKINGELPLTVSHFKSLEPDDLDHFMGEYLSFFLVNSLLKKMRNG